MATLQEREMEWMKVASRAREAGRRAALRSLEAWIEAEITAGGERVEMARALQKVAKKLQGLNDNTPASAAAKGIAIDTALIASSAVAWQRIGLLEGEIQTLKTAGQALRSRVETAETALVSLDARVGALENA